jgi:glucan-binding YG repeat protein
MKRKLTGFLVATGMFAMLASAGAFAAGWSTNQNGQQIYVNDQGKAVTNSWIKADNNGSVVWYYATSNGSLASEGWQTINGHKYYFDASGVMQTGWVDDNRYYCDPASGAMAIGWKQLQIPEEFYAESEESGYQTGDTRWFYFNSNGQVFRSDDSDKVTVKTIDNARYGFDRNGVMVTGWAKTEDKDPAIAGYCYFTEKQNGSFKEGQQLRATWFTTVGPTKQDGSVEDDLASGNVEYFYFKADGHPVAGLKDNSMVERVGGKRYLFNEYGNPLYGMQKGSASAGGEIEYYYCGPSKSDCSVRTGKFNMTQGNGEKITFYAEASGRGYTGVKDNYLYYKGKLQKSESSFMVCYVNNKPYVINTNGQVQKSKSSLRDRDGNKVSTNSDGTLKANLDGSFDVLQAQAPEVDDID